MCNGVFVFIILHLDGRNKCRLSGSNRLTLLKPCEIVSMLVARTQKGFTKSPSLVEKVCATGTEVDDLGTTIAVFLQSGTFCTVIGIRDT